MTSPSVGRVSVKVTPEISDDARSKIKRQLEAIRDVTLTVGTRLDTSGLRNQLRAVSESTRGVVARVPVEFVPQVAILRARLEALVQAAASGISAEVDVNVNQSSLSRLRNSLSAGGGGDGNLLAKSLGLITKSMLGLAAAGAGVQTIVGLSAALAQLAPIALALPGILLGIGAAALTAKLGFQEFGEAVSSGDLSKLAPSAREAATALRGFSTEWKAIQQGVQQNLFKGLAADIKAAGSANLPVLSAGLRDIATQLNVVASGALKATQSPFFQDDLSQILGNTAGLFKNIGSGVGDLISGIVGLGGVGSTYLPALGTAIGNVASKFKQWVDSGVENGSIQRMIDAAIAGFKDLFAILGNVASIAGSVFSGLNAGSGATSFLATIRDTTASLSELAASDGAQRTLSALGSVMATAGQAVRDVLINALEAVQPIILGLAPLFTAFGQAVSQFATSGALQTLGEAIGSVASALSAGLAPILPLIAEAFAGLVSAVAPIVAALAPVVSQLLAGLLPALKAIIPPLVTAATTIGQALATAIQGLVDSGAITAIATAFGECVTALVPLIEPLTNLAVTLFPIVADVIQSVVVPAIQAIASALPTIVDAILPVIAQAQQFADGFKRNFDQAQQDVKTAVDAITNILNFFGELPGKFGKWLDDTGRAVSDGIAKVVQFFRDAPGKITSALGDLGSLLVRAGKSLMDGLGQGIRDGLQAVLDFAAGIAAKIAAVKGPIPKDRKELVPAGLALMAGLHKGLRSGFKPVLAEASHMASQLADAFDWNERTFPNLGTSVSGSMVGIQYASIDHSMQASVNDPGFGDRVAQVLEGWTVQIDRNGLAKMVNKSNNERKRR